MVVHQLTQKDIKGNNSPVECQKEEEVVDQYIQLALNSGKQENTAIVLIGAPASGKSSGKNHFFNNILKKDANDFINCDPDEVMMKIWGGPSNNCRQQINFINETIFYKAIENGSNVIFDATGRMFPRHMRNIVNPLLKFNYIVHIVIVINSFEVSMKRAKIREKQTNRGVPTKFVQDTINSLYVDIPHYISLGCKGKNYSTYLYDNSGENIKLLSIMQCQNDKKTFTSTLDDEVFNMTPESPMAKYLTNNKSKKRKNRMKSRRKKSRKYLRNKHKKSRRKK